MQFLAIKIFILICLNAIHQTEGFRSYTYPGEIISGVPDPFYYNDTGFLDVTCMPKNLHGGTCRHECDRPCKPGDHRICYYRLNIESMEAHNPEACSQRDENGNYHPDCIRIDGVRSPILTINRMFPGPLIAVCLGDTIVADVANHMTNFSQYLIPNVAIERNLYRDMKAFRVIGGEEYVPNLAKNIWNRHYRDYVQRMQNHQRAVNSTSKDELVYLPNPNIPGESTTIHFHGAYQKSTPQCDGVPWITQDPIQPGSVFRYRFVNDNSGTFFYHSHMTFQRGEGIAAPYIVRTPNDPHKKLFHFDGRIAIITDYGHNLSHAPDNLIINSYGCLRRANAKPTGYLTKYNVRSGYSYRFHFIFNGINSLKLLCFFEKHSVLLTAVDGNPIKPVNISSFVMGTGERLDIILRADQKISNYALHCISTTNSTLRQAAILHYKEAKFPPRCSQVNFSTPVPAGLQYNKENAFPGTPNVIVLSELQSLEKIDKICGKRDVEKYHIQLKVSGLGFQLNDITNLAPKQTLMNQMIEKGYINETGFCDEANLRNSNVNCLNRTCECTHTWKLPKGKCIEVFVLGAHPLHLHRTEFYVVGTVKDPDNKPLTIEKIQEMDRAGLIKRNLIDPPIKDTVVAPRDGASIIRFVTENLGLWYTHCHIELHGMSGMSETIWIGPEKNFALGINPHHHYKSHQNNICR